MLIDFKPVAGVLGQIYKPEELWEKVETGVFITHLSGKNHFPNTEERPEFNQRDSYGVCDNLSQIKSHYPELIESNRKFVVLMTEIRHDEQTEQGWRWRKWGDYIGIHKPQHEYLLDEVGIEKVFVYKILEFSPDSLT
jgi:hypothetical protein